jgi:hypothetical protein
MQGEVASEQKVDETDTSYLLGLSLVFFPAVFSIVGALILTFYIPRLVGTTRP